MKKLVFLFMLAVLCVPSIYSSDDYYAYSYARLSYVQGDIFIQRAEGQGYEEGQVNFPVVEGDVLNSRNGYAELHFGKKNYLRIDSNTQVELKRLPIRGDNLISLHLLAGSIYLRIHLLGHEKDFEVHTPDASFFILDEGLYRIDVGEYGETRLYVHSGTIEAAGEEGSFLVESRQSLVAEQGYFRSGPSYAYAQYEDNFASWNRTRDSFHNRVVSQRYLPDELYAYEAELSYHGRWIYERPYGYVWVPSVYNSSWQPYLYGRWVWLPVIGWTWVSNEPWGWCAYHYGRWQWRLGLGWYWIPTVRWGPAWVSWYRSYDYWGWCPLSYHGYPGVIINNIYYGRHYHRHYPYNSRSLVVVHKNQLRASRISKVAIARHNISRMGKISLSSRQPDFQRNWRGISNKRAENVFRSTKVRAIHKNYSHNAVTKTSINRNKSNVYKSRSPVRSTQNIRKSKRNVLENPKKTSERLYRSRVSSQGSHRVSSIQSTRRSIKTYSSSANIRSRSKIKSYSSPRTSLGFRSRSSSQMNKEVTSPAIRSKTSRSYKYSPSRISSYPSQRYSPSFRPEAMRSINRKTKSPVIRSDSSRSRQFSHSRISSSKRPVSPKSMTKHSPSSRGQKAARRSSSAARSKRKR